MGFEFPGEQGVDGVRGFLGDAHERGPPVGGFGGARDEAAFVEFGQGFADASSGHAELRGEMGRGHGLVEVAQRNEQPDLGRCDGRAVVDVLDGAVERGVDAVDQGYDFHRRRVQAGIALGPEFLGARLERKHGMTFVNR